jgi:thymidylate synthase (FAD)
MREFRDINVTCLARTTVDRANVRRWLDELGATAFEIPPPEQVCDSALLVALAAKQCYMSFQPGLNPNVTKVRSDMVDYLDNVLAQKHGSVLQHAVFTFGINGCSRVFTGEMNRHSAGVAISERSMRYIRYEEIPYWVPTCFQPVIGDSVDLAEKKAISRAIMRQAFAFQEESMKLFAATWAAELSPESSFHGKKTLTSAFRRVIGMGIGTGGVWTLNIRALRHVIALRTDPSAEEEMVHIVGKIGRYMLAELPELFGDFTEVGSALVPQYWKV